MNTCQARVTVLTLILAFSLQGSAQEQKPMRDSLRITHASDKSAHDSLKVRQDSITFRALETYSKKSKFMRFIHGLIFKNVAAEPGQAVKKSKAKALKPYRKPEGKIVRNIFITTLNPFGYSLQDTTVHPQGFISQAGNFAHIKTRTAVIQNLLLFRKNDPYDSMRVNETVRLIRSQRYIRDVFLYTQANSRKADSVDVYIRASDVWSIFPALSISGLGYKAVIRDENFIGLGNSFHGSFQRTYNTGSNITRLSYLVQNIRNSYVSLNIQYLFPGKTDLVKNYEFVRSYYSPLTSNLNYLFSGNKDILRSIELSRSFYSPLTRWAGGIFIGQLIAARSYIQNDTTKYLASRSNIKDFWIARSWEFFRYNNPYGRITSFIISGRLVSTRYPGNPPFAGPVNLFRNNNFYFAGLGFTSRRYVKDKFIFNYGKTEDVPAGKAFLLTTGIDVQDKSRLYFGLKGSVGDYYKFGYLSTDLEYGTFIGSGKMQQGAITARINYFTKLLDIKSWKLRQFVRPALIWGLNRLPEDNLTFDTEIRGFEKLEYSASRMLVLTLQTQSYSPWSLLGFNFGPYLFSSFGILGSESNGFSKSRIYSLFGLGVLIKNNYLTFSTFQVSLSYYPNAPGYGSNIFRTNAYSTSDYGFMDFDISKPGVVNYR